MNGSRGVHFRQTSPESRKYNCIAWAAEDTQQWWWPDPAEISYWPVSVARKVDIPSFISVFRTLGYEVCPDGNHEIGYIKIALFCDNQDIPTHAARQLPNGFWTSKLGPYIDVEHDLDGFANIPRIIQEYGRIKVFMKRLCGIVK
jgi:hypothetical protein